MASPWLLLLAVIAVGLLLANLALLLLVPA